MYFHGDGTYVIQFYIGKKHKHIFKCFINDSVSVCALMCLFQRMDYFYIIVFAVQWLILWPMCFISYNQFKTYLLLLYFHVHKFRFISFVVISFQDFCHFHHFSKES